MIETIKHHMPSEDLIRDMSNSAKELDYKFTRQQLINFYRVMWLTVEKYDQTTNTELIEQQKEESTDDQNTQEPVEENMGGMDGGSMSELSGDEDTGASDADPRTMGSEKV
jgi:hypothetical protein